MNNNVINRYIYFIIFISLLNFSCKKNREKTEKRIQKDRLIGTEKDTLFRREWMIIEFANNRKEEIEIYISENNDTISNQQKILNGKNIDTIKSCYYDLKLTKTNKPHVYSGQITLHSQYKNLKLNKKNRRRIEFAFCNQKKDSAFLRYVESKNSNTINFEFENYYGNRLQGQLYQIVERDTLIKNEEMINLNQFYLMVDNQAETINIFLDSEHVKKNKFSSENLKLTRKK